MPNTDSNHTLNEVVGTISFNGINEEVKNIKPTDIVKPKVITFIVKLSNFASKESALFSSILPFSLFITSFVDLDEGLCCVADNIELCSKLN
jgi:hypothetical protein